MVEAEENFSLEGSMMDQEPLSGHFIAELGNKINLYSSIYETAETKDGSLRFLLFWPVNLSRGGTRVLVYFKHY